MLRIYFGNSINTQTIACLAIQQLSRHIQFLDLIIAFGVFYAMVVAGLIAFITNDLILDIVLLNLISNELFGL